MVWVVGVVASISALGNGSASPQATPASPPSQVSTCLPDAEELKRLLTLTPFEFDQSTTAGWRHYASKRMLC
jgi:hypothetical protein